MTPQPAVPVTIRDLIAADEAGWRRLWDEYLAFYKAGIAPEVTENTWTRLLDPAESHACRVAVSGEDLLGFAIHLTHGSTWVIGNDCYLEDLCVTEAARGKGIGRALIEDLITLGHARGWNRLYWHTDQQNTRAQALYNSFLPSDGYLRYRINLSEITPPSSG